MAIAYLGISQRMAVTTSDQALSLPRNAPQCRVYNLGDTDCRIDFDTTVSASSPILPAGGWETRTKYNANSLHAACDTGTTTIEFCACSGD